jgi:hypothetical protein
MSSNLINVDDHTSQFSGSSPATYYRCFGFKSRPRDQGRANGGCVGFVAPGPPKSGAPFGVSKPVLFLNKSCKIMYKNLGGGPKKEALHPGPKISLHGPAGDSLF